MQVNDSVSTYSLDRASLFAQQLIHWQRQHGRHGLPWQASRDPYRVWLSEIMLQQTQVNTVIPYYQRFLECFPNVDALANASLDRVLQLWSGLGYYSRARNLHAAAQRIMQVFGGAFPQDIESLITLPGVGRSTAGAILAFCFAKRAAILDGNVKRVLTRQFGISGQTNQRAVEISLWELAEKILPNDNVSAYTQALMDLGALVCTRRKPRCEDCPVMHSCVAKHTDQVDVLPTPKSKRSVPHQALYLLICMYQDSIYLIQRPATGIWAKLWCLPDYTNAAECEQACVNLFGIPPHDKWEGTPFRHTLTHRHLDITPVWIVLAGKPCSSQGRWVSHQQALTMGIPVPVRKILSVRQMRPLQ